MAYNFKQIEQKWQEIWEKQHVFRTDDDFSKPKYFAMDMFPYPSGAGLHVGHPEGYTATDIVARYKRMRGFNVLHPMGFDTFGLPTERYSMQTGIHPAVATEKNVENFTRQLKMLGFGYDWSRRVLTSDPKYYKWTQWIFSIIYNSWFDEETQTARPIAELPIPDDCKTELEIENYRDSKRLAFIAHIPVNWCEALGTVLANEEVDEWVGKGYTVERRPMRQWMLRITAYAGRLLDDLELVDWVTSTKEMQKHWIGQSEGAEVNFQVNNSSAITVFTTRPDTIFGATYCVLAPEHPLVSTITSDEQRAKVDDYIRSTSLKSDLDRTELNKAKSGIFTGGFAINPATGKEIPVWIADYVLAHYGTGAIMAVPGHDERDHEFAVKYSLPILQVVADSESEWDIQKKAFCENGSGLNSANDEVSLNGLPTSEAKKTIINWLESNGIGKRKIQFKLRDWLFSRQRYWGEPIPIMFFEDGTKRCLELDELPLELPVVQDFQPAGTGESPLAKVDSWVNFIDKKTGKRARFETNTMPQWAGSCWYYLRYIDPNNELNFCDAEKEKYWMQGQGVDLYIGGTEHAVLHLLYARFWHKILFDYGYVSTPEPFGKLFHQGMILGEDSRKMSKSLGNVVNPDDVVNEFGADSLRLFEMFMGPLEMTKPWATKGVEGVFRFLNRVWRMIVEENETEAENSSIKLAPEVQDVPMTKEQERVLHFTIKKVGLDIENLSFNTAISQMMIFVNEFTKSSVRPREAMEKFVLCLSAFAPHIAEELWRILGNDTFVLSQKFPDFDEAKLTLDEVEIVVQINSKVRSKAIIPAGAEENVVVEIAKNSEIVQKYLEGVSIVKTIFVLDKLVNFIVK